MNDFFGTHYSQEDLQQKNAQRRGRNHGLPRPTSMPMAAQPQDAEGPMDMNTMMGGDSLDDIIMQNNKELQRRQSFHSGYPSQDMDRRTSMMAFGPGSNNLHGYQFGDPTSVDQNLRRQSTGELDITGGYGDMSSGMNLGSQMAFSSPMQAPSLLSINTNSQYGSMSPDMMSMQNMQNMIGYGSMSMEGISDTDPSHMAMYSPTSYTPTYGGNGMDPMSNAMTPTYMMHQNVPDGMLSHSSSLQGPAENENDIHNVLPGLSVSDASMVQSPRIIGMNQGMDPYSTPAVNMPEPPPRTPSYPTTPTTTAPEMTMEPKPEKPPTYQGIYSSSGFDMLGALMKVATRKDPEINIGKVDMSCAFVVCDVTQYDCPIIYVSDIFERLTGYNKHEVKGQNCRFLQSPEGKVQAGARREFVDNDSVYYLRNKIADKKEAQRSLINYRKGGQPFMNLLTMIPITGEDDINIKYFVGFQVDLVEKPASVEGKNASGLYTVDYSQNMLPRYVWTPPENPRFQMDTGQTIPRDEVSNFLTAVNNNNIESDITKRMWDKVLLENTDDVVHVLSLKGLFLYLSPSSRTVLEYDASELVGTALSSVCHPSDIVPVTRELKDTSTGSPVNVVFRIRRKKSGYTWFESHGSLCVEQGKGRKCIILVGRERPVYAIGRNEIEAAGGIGESEMWIKLSTSGMFLFASSNIKNLLDRSPEELIGTSIQALMRQESRVEFGRSLEKARTGKLVTHKHDILNKRGLLLQARTTLYPGDASEGQKPTFLVAQIRLLKVSSRSSAPALSSQGNANSASSPLARISDDATPVTHPSGTSSNVSQELSTPRSTASAMNLGPVSQAGGSGLPIGSQDLALAAEDNIFDELKTTRCTSWQFELRQMEKKNRILAEELATLLSNKKKRKRRKGAGHAQRDCANCHTRSTPEWRRGPSGLRDLCNSCGLRWAKQTGRVSPRTSTKGGDGSKTSQRSTSPIRSSPLNKEILSEEILRGPDLNANNETQGDVKGDGAAIPAKLGGRSTTESMPIHKPSQGFRDGGERGITNIEE